MVDIYLVTSVVSSMHNFPECAMCVLRLGILCGVVSPCNFIYHSRFSLYFVCGDRPTMLIEILYIFLFSLSSVYVCL